MRLARRLAKCLGKPGDHLRVDRIVLGQPSGRQRKAADPLGIDNPHLDAGLAARCAIHARSRHSPPSLPLPTWCLRSQAASLRWPCVRAQARLPQATPTNARIHLVFGDIDTHDNAIILCHHPLPSLLGSGSKPLQLFGLRKTPELSLALTQAIAAFGALRAQFQQRAVLREPPVRTFWLIFRTQGALAIVADVGQGAVDANVATDERDVSVR